MSELTITKSQLDELKRLNAKFPVGSKIKGGGGDGVVVDVDTDRPTYHEQDEVLSIGGAFSIPPLRGAFVAIRWSDGVVGNNSEHQIKSVIRPDEQVHVEDVSANEALLRVATVHGLTVSFKYAKGKGDVIEQRRLQPTDLLAKADHVTFVGNDPDRDDVRAYRTDRIKGLVEIDA